MNKLNIYIDIDGVLLTRKGEIPSYGIEFITYLINNFDCYWLTTHCRAGENRAVEYLSRYYDPQELELMKLIKPTDWNDKKTEGINFNEPFLWLDDYPFQAEKLDLKKQQALDRLIVVDLLNENELESVIKKIAQWF